jgi:hypothetical protein
MLCARLLQAKNRPSSMKFLDNPMKRAKAGGVAGPASSADAAAAGSRVAAPADAVPPKPSALFRLARAVGLRKDTSGSRDGDRAAAPTGAFVAMNPMRRAGAGAGAATGPGAGDESKPALRSMKSRVSMMTKGGAVQVSPAETPAPDEFTAVNPMRRAGAGAGAAGGGGAAASSGEIKPALRSMKSRVSMMTKGGAAQVSPADTPAPDEFSAVNPMRRPSVVPASVGNAVVPGGGDSAATDAAPKLRSMKSRVAMISKPAAAAASVDARQPDARQPDAEHHRHP